jgi:hypothetical protein
VSQECFTPESRLPSFATHLFAALATQSLVQKNGRPKMEDTARSTDKSRDVSQACFTPESHFRFFATHLFAALAIQSLVQKNGRLKMRDTGQDRRISPGEVSQEYFTPESRLRFFATHLFAALATPKANACQHTAFWYCRVDFGCVKLHVVGLQAELPAMRVNS